MKKYNLLLLKNFQTEPKTERKIKTTLSIITACLITACSSTNNHYDEHLNNNAEKNTPNIPVCVQNNHQTKPIFNITSFNSYFGKTDIYYTPFVDNLTVSFENHIPEEFFNKILQHHDVSISNYPIIERTFGENVLRQQPEIFFTKIFYTDNQGEKQELSAIKFLDEGRYFKKFKAKFSNYKITSDNFNEFVFLHELFHAEREGWMTEIGTNVGEYFSDISAVLGISIKNNYSYEVFKHFLESIEKSRKPDHNYGNSHYNPQLWNDNSIIPSHDEYKEFVNYYKTIQYQHNDIPNYAEFDETEGCYIIDLEKARELSSFENNISQFFKDRIKKSIKKTPKT